MVLYVGLLCRTISSPGAVTSQSRVNTVKLKTSRGVGCLEVLISFGGAGDMVCFFVIFGQNQAYCFHLFLVFMVNYANHRLAVASYLTNRHESAIDILI